MKVGNNCILLLVDSMVKCHRACLLQDIGAPVFTAPVDNKHGGIPKGQSLPNGQSAQLQSQISAVSDKAAPGDCEGALDEWRRFVSKLPAESETARVERINSISRFFRT